MHARSLLFFLPLLTLAQATAPPPEVDQALRERCTEFFTYHSDNETHKPQFRKAYELVADDFKDFYFTGHKQAYKSFKIDSIKYTDNFTKAKVQLTTEVVWEIRMHRQVAKVTTSAAWKIQDGKWFWYDDPQDRWPTPMGPSDINALTKNPDGSIRLPHDFSPDAIKAAAQTLVQATKIDKNEVVFSPEKGGSDKVVLHNGAPGYVNLELEKGVPVPGLTLELDKTQVGPNQDATLKIVYKPAPKDDEKPLPDVVTAKLTIAPFSQVFAVSIRIGAPPQ